MVADSLAAGKKNTWCRTVLAVVCLLAIVFCLPAPAAEQKPRDMVVVIDVSASMAEHFDTAKAEAKNFISSAQIGDRVTVITFGKSSHLLVRSRITSSHTIGRILSEVEKLSPVELNTNLPSALEAGLKEMEQFYVESPNTERILMWLSDDKDNPPEDIPNLITFASLKEEHEKFVPDHTWFVFEKPIQTDTKSEMDWFMDWAKRNHMKLDARASVESLGTLTLPDTQVQFTVSFQPNSAGIWGTSFSVVAEVTDEERGNYSASVPIKPPVVVCDSKAWDQKFEVSLPDRPGSYVCRVSFVLPSDNMLEISPPQIGLDVALKVKEEPVEKQVATIEKIFDSNYQATLRNRTEQDSLFAKGLRGEMISNFKSAVQREMLIFGPIVSGGQYQEVTNLTVNKEIPLESVSMKTNFKLPEGIRLEPIFSKSGSNLVADLRLHVEENMVPEDGWEVQGAISFLTSEQHAKISPSAIPIRFYTRPDISAWGRRELNSIPIDPKYGKALAKYALEGGKVLGAFLLFWLTFHLIKRYVFSTTDLIGMLEVSKNPTKVRIRYFNLQRLGKLKKKNALTIGKSRKADIVLPHPSVSDIHAKIMTTKIDATTIIFVAPLNGNQVKVNEITYSREKEISDCDKLIIGEFVFLYKRPEIYRETVLHFNDGALLRGTLVSWDIDAPTFEFLPINAPSIHAKMVVNFSDLKMVSFVRKKEKFSLDRIFGPARPMGYPVEVFFKDGDLLEGYMMTETGEWNKRFYVLPKSSEQVALILVERAATDSVLKREAFKEPFFNLRRLLRALIPHTSS